MKYCFLILIFAYNATVAAAKHQELLSAPPRGEIEVPERRTVEGHFASIIYRFRNREHVYWFLNMYIGILMIFNKFHDFLPKVQMDATS